MKRGLFIVIEGLDKSGKTTQANLLCDYLSKKGFIVENWSFPNRETQIGRLCDSYLKNNVNLDKHVIHLLFSANRWEQADRINNLLNSGVFIVCTRYTLSGVVYSSTLGLDREWCMNCDRDLPKPDITIFLDVKPEETVHRYTQDIERYENISFQTNVYNEYKKNIDGSIYVIDGSLSKEEIFKKMVNILSSYKDIILC